jgi:ribosomal RNA assembly protein
MYITVDDEKLNIIKRIISDLERIGNVKIVVDDKSKNIHVVPIKGNVYDAFKITNVIKAIGYGFKPNDAMKLLSDDYRLEVIELKDFARNNDDLRRIKGRIIGEQGKSKRIIQEYTGVEIIVGENFVAILGIMEQVEIAKNAIMMLIEGKQHSTVYKYLDKAENELRAERFKALRRKSQNF